MSVSWKKIVSGSIAATFIAWACFAGGLFAGVYFGAFEVIGLILIWNSDDLGGATFPRLIIGSTPAWIVNVSGWFVLLFPIVIIWLSK